MQNSLFKIDNPILQQLGYALLFGFFSMLFGFVQLTLPGMEGVGSDFREIPLLIGVFYITNPIYLLISSFLTSLSAPSSAMISTFTMHFVATWAALALYKKIKAFNFSHYTIGIIWIFVTVIYYYVFLIPTLVIVNELMGMNSEVGMLSSYSRITSTFSFELISSALVSSVFLIQLQIRRSLEDHKKNLVIMVNKKTKALADANLELKNMNENLDHMVKERTQKVQEQYQQMLKYAYLNSHEVRAPLSRMQGLMSIIIQEQDIQSKMELIEKLKISSEELDAIIIEMNQILESELIKDKIAR